MAGEVVAFADELVAAMRSHPRCVGLAAVQLGVPWRVFCLDVGGHRKTVSYGGLVVLVNPRVVDADEFRSGREGCLSVPDLTGDVPRAQRIVVSGMVPGSGAERLVEADAYEAVGLQHELDHLDGVLFLDRVAGAHGLYARKRYR